MNKFLYFLLPLTLLYPLFFSKLYDLSFAKENIKCKIDYTNFNDPVIIKQKDICLEKEETIRTQNNDNKYVFMIVIGILSIICGLFISQSYSNLNNIGISIATAGLFQTVLYTIYNWSNINDLSKLFVTGLAIIILFYSSSKTYLTN